MRKRRGKDNGGLRPDPPYARLAHPSYSLCDNRSKAFGSLSDCYGFIMYFAIVHNHPFKFDSPNHAYRKILRYDMSQF